MGGGGSKAEEKGCEEGTYRLSHRIEKPRTTRILSQHDKLTSTCHAALQTKLGVAHRATYKHRSTSVGRVCLRRPLVYTPGDDLKKKNQENSTPCNTPCDSPQIHTRHPMMRCLHTCLTTPSSPSEAKTSSGMPAAENDPEVNPGPRNPDSSSSSSSAGVAEIVGATVGAGLGGAVGAALASTGSALGAALGAGLGAGLVRRASGLHERKRKEKKRKKGVTYSVLTSDGCIESDGYGAENK